MKVYKKVILLPILFMFIFTISFPKSVKADELQPNVYSYTWQEDTLLSGGGEISKTFYVPENMKSSNFTVALKIKQSPTLIKDLSSISILVNNTKVHSIMMDKVNSNGEITIKVPEHLINKGENSITISGFLKSTREKCEYNNDVNWVLIEKNSTFTFNYSRADSTNINSIFDNTYYSDGKRSEVNVVLPNELTDYNYSQISSVSTLLGFAHKNKELNVDIKALKYADLNKLDKETIVIGTAEQIKAMNKGLLNNEEWKRAEDNGYIAIRKIGKKNHFVIITSTEEQLEILCKILSKKSSLAQIKGNNYILDSAKVVKEKEFNVNPSLKDLGYETTSKAGNGIKAFNYYFTIPASKRLTDKNKISIAYNYSSLVDYDNGYINVEINGENILSKRFPKEKSEDTIEFSIPEKYFDNTTFSISINFNLKPGVEYCTSQSHENIWAKIDSDNSRLNLELTDREKYSLINSQGILQDSNGKIQGKILVDSYENLLVDSITKFSYYLGKVSQGVNNLYINKENKGEDNQDINKGNNSKDNQGDNKVNSIDNNNNTDATDKKEEDNTNTDATDKKEEDNTSDADIKYKNTAIFALTSSEVIKTMKDKLVVPILDNGEFIENNLFIQNTSSLGAIELTSNNNLLITASDKEQLNNTIEKYPEAISNKNAVVIMDGEVIDSFEEVKKEENKIIEKIKVNYDIIIALGVLVIAAILIYTIYHKKVK